MVTLMEGANMLSWPLLSLGLMLIVAGHERNGQFIRPVLCALSASLSLRYVSWRFTDTLPEPDLTAGFFIALLFVLLETVSAIHMCGALFMLSRTRNRSKKADQNAKWWAQKKAPRVEIYITTYNEGRDVIERTIAGACTVQYPNFGAYVLDDGMRSWLAEYCARNNVGYITRPDKRHAKAGNINHAFRLRRAGSNPPDFIAILDADFVPHRYFIARTISLFHDPKAALVQTPQHFFNPDPIQHNLGVTHITPDEQRFFFDYVLPSRDAWGIAACCGTSSLIRAAALEEVGGFPTGSVTEDFLVTLRLAEAGHKTVYLNEPLSEGLAPEGLGEYLTQRGRWAVGTMEIVRNHYNPLSSRHGLSIRGRLGVVDSVPIRLTQTPTTCRVRPIAGIEFGKCR